MREVMSPTEGYPLWVSTEFFILALGPQARLAPFLQRSGGLLSPEGVKGLKGSTETPQAAGGPSGGAGGLRSAASGPGARHEGEGPAVPGGSCPRLQPTRSTERGWWAQRGRRRCLSSWDPNVGRQSR